MFYPTLEDYIRILRMLFDLFIQEKAEKKRRGRPVTYKEISLILFFMMMQARRCFHFKAQRRWLENHKDSAKTIGFSTLPSRWTLSRRYKKLYPVLQTFIDFIGKWAKELDEVFRDDVLFEDKSLFKAKGPVWHRKDQPANRIPAGLRNLDTEGSWSKSGYHGWVYGYGLHTTVTCAGFPRLAQVETASVSESEVIDQKQNQLIASGVQTLVADDNYTNFKRVRRLAKVGICLLTPALRAHNSAQSKKYHAFIEQSENQALLKLRKTAIEPVFDLISRLLDTTENHKQLSVKGLANVRTFLALGVLMVQLAMVVNSAFLLPLRNISHLLAVFS